MTSKLQSKLAMRLRFYIASVALLGGIALLGGAALRAAILHPVAVPAIFSEATR